MTPPRARETNPTIGASHRGRPRRAAALSLPTPSRGQSQSARSIACVASMSRDCWVWLSCLGVGWLEQAPDAAGEVALQAADRFARALALAASAGDVVAGRLVGARAGDDHAVQRGVDL